MPALRRGVLVAVAVAIMPIAARAADLPVIRVFPPECAAAPVSFDDFVDTLRVELAGRQPHCCVVGPEDDPATDAVKVTLTIEPCDPATEDVGVNVEVAATQRTIRRDVSLADLPPEARPRALALAVAELMRETGEPAPPPVPPPPPPPPAPRLMLGGGVAGDVRRHFAHPATLFGARLELTLSSAHVQVALDVGAAATSSAQSLGDVSILVASATLSIGPRITLGPTVLTFGPAASLGWASIKGHSTDPDVIPGEGGGLVSTLGVRAGIEAPVPRVLRVFGTLEGGGTVRGLDADVAGQPAIGISGAYVLFAVGVRFGPS